MIVRNGEMIMRNIYNKALKAARRAYDKATEPAWHAYKKATEEADDAYNKAIEPARRAYDKATEEAERAYKKATEQEPAEDRRLPANHLPAPDELVETETGELKHFGDWTADDLRSAIERLSAEPREP